MVSKHFSHNVPVLRYIGLIELEDYTADNILTQILEFIQNNGLNLDNLIHFGSDDASTMVVKNLYQILDSIIDALNFDNLHAGDQRDRDRAKKLLELFKSLLDATIAMIKTQFIGFDDQPPIYGTNLQQFLQNNPFYNNHIPNDFVYFAKALVHSLQAHFSHNDLYDSMKILDPKELPLQESALSSYGIEELKLLCKHFGNQKHKSNVPLSNANVERVFSQHKLTKTRLRNRLNVETLDMHLTILLNAPDNI
ncbi:unnamed protein product [Rhizophagus irregularis]|nr:unnamed protein product [Rhizophagus irregularis]